VAEGDDKTLPATERRRQQARDEGQAPLSKEIVACSGLAAAALMVGMVVPTTSRTLARSLESMLANPQLLPGAALSDAATAMLVAILPITGAILFAASMAVMLQTGWLFNTHALLPDLGRLDPRRGLKRLFGVNNAIEAAKAVAKIAILAWAVWHVVAGTVAGIAGSLSWTLPTVLDQLARDTLHVMLVVLGCQSVLALLDMGWVRYRFSQQLRMSLDDVKREQKEVEGDPRYKAKLKQIRLLRARRRMLAAVAKATVVVTNPTHYAVALAYQRGSKSAPKVVAKGTDDVAARIREAAKKHGVPLVPNPPLARALHGLELDAEVPQEHFRAVAEIIAYVWRLRSGTRAAAETR
jgi:flagellar biosynthetic protein FlhB